MARGAAEAKPRCGPESGHVVPVIDRGRCGAKEDCVRVCPFHVFEVRRLTPEERLDVPFIGRLKLLVHGGRQAVAVRAADCHACGVCISACPEGAIRLLDA